MPGGQIRPHIEIYFILSLPTNLPHENAFLYLEYDDKQFINERKSPKRNRCKIIFSFIWLILLEKLEKSCSNDHFSHTSIYPALVS